MFKYQKSTGERVMHYRLVESYRVDGQVKHETILNPGTLDELPEVERKKVLATYQIDSTIRYQLKQKGINHQKTSPSPEKNL